MELLQNERFVETLNDNKGPEDPNGQNNVIEKVERFKQHIKVVAIDRSIEMNFEWKRQDAELKELLNWLKVEEAHELGTFISDIHNTNAKIEALKQKNIKEHW